MRLDINGIEVDCIIGDRPDERLRLQRVILDARLEVSDRSSETDALEDAADYTAVAAAMRDALVEAKPKMVERAARIAAEACLGVANVDAATVGLVKSGAVPGIASVRAEWCAKRSVWKRAAGAAAATEKDESKEKPECSPKPRRWWPF